MIEKESGRCEGILGERGRREARSRCRFCRYLYMWLDIYCEEKRGDGRRRRRCTYRSNGFDDETL
jgi:hypothetical protein